MADYRLTDASKQSNQQIVMASHLTAAITPAGANYQFYLNWLQSNEPDPPLWPVPADHAQLIYAAIMSDGLSTTWNSSVALNGAYPLGIDPITGGPIQTAMMGEMVSIAVNGAFTNGQSTRGWPTTTGAYNVFTMAQFKALATAIALYMDQLAIAMATATAGGVPSWPVNSVTING